MALNEGIEQYMMLEFANTSLEQCWDVCYDRNITRDELVRGDVEDSKGQKMAACARKCVARHFEVLKLLSESRELREKEAMQGLAPGTLSNPK